MVERTYSRSKKDTRNPCAVCGWGKHMAIHQPPLNAPANSKAFGHEFVPMQTDDARKANVTVSR